MIVAFPMYSIKFCNLVLSIFDAKNRDARYKPTCLFSLLRLFYGIFPFIQLLIEYPISLISRLIRCIVTRLIEYPSDP